VPSRSQKPKRKPDTLEELKGKWFRPEMVRLLRQEEESPEGEELDISHMPEWAGKHFAKLIRTFSDGRGFIDALKLDFATSEHFGEILGMKCFWAHCFINFHNMYVSADDATRAKLTKFLDGPEGVSALKAELPSAKRTLQIERKAFSRAQKQNLIERGHFFKGFGRGLLLAERLQSWLKSDDKRKQNECFLSSYIFINWKEIQEAGEHGGWPAILEDFQKCLPMDANISEDAFAKALKRAGIGPVGRRGRPRKSDNNQQTCPK
jgi:hypothetical protein